VIVLETWAVVERSIISELGELMAIGETKLSSPPVPEDELLQPGTEHAEARWPPSKTGMDSTPITLAASNEQSRCCRMFSTPCV